MNPAELDTLTRGVIDLAGIAAVWSVLFFGRVKVSSPPTQRPPAQPKPEVTAGVAPETADVTSRRPL